MLESTRQGELGRFLSYITIRYTILRTKMLAFGVWRLALFGVFWHAITLFNIYNSVKMEKT